MGVAVRNSVMAHWETLCADPQRAGLPDKFETAANGKIVLRPMSVKHASLQGDLLVALHAIAAQAGTKGKVVPECPVVTADGVKSPDVAWLSDAEVKTFVGKSATPTAPTICIKVKSPSNSGRDLDTKRALCFAAGATEVWLCDERSALRFWNAGGRIRQSTLFANFPKRLGDA